MQLDEVQIIKECQAGNIERFGVIYDAYIRKIYNFIYYKTHHKETAEDLTSETFRKAMMSLQSFDTERTFSSWLYKIAQNTVIDHYRTFRPNANVDDIWDLADDRDIERDADVKIKLERVEEYLKTIPSAKRDIIIMRVWQGMSYKEIAEVVGKSEDSCKMMFSRTMTELRKTMPLVYLLFLFMKHTL
jgi:RNA polymerase sigma-70 factor, ECF subfamily